VEIQDPLSTLPICHAISSPCPRRKLLVLMDNIAGPARLYKD